MISLAIWLILGNHSLLWFDSQFIKNFFSFVVFLFHGIKIDWICLLKQESFVCLSVIRRFRIKPNCLLGCLRPYILNLFCFSTDNLIWLLIIGQHIDVINLNKRFFICDSVLWDKFIYHQNLFFFALAIIWSIRVWRRRISGRFATWESLIFFIPNFNFSKAVLTDALWSIATANSIMSWEFSVCLGHGILAFAFIIHLCNEWQVKIDLFVRLNDFRSEFVPSSQHE